MVGTSGEADLGAEGLDAHLGGAVIGEVLRATDKSGHDDRSAAIRVLALHWQIKPAGFFGAMLGEPAARSGVRERAVRFHESARAANRGGLHQVHVRLSGSATRGRPSVSFGKPIVLALLFPRPG